MVLGQGQTYIGKAQVVGVYNQTVYEPIKNKNGQIIGIWYVGVPNTVYDELAGNFQRMIIIISLLAVVLACLIIWQITRRMTKPLLMLETVTNKVARGDLTQEVERIKSRDEIGSLAVAFSRMIENTRNVLLEIRKSSGEVATGALNISQASATLSDGGARQAASIEELNVAIGEIAAQTRNNEKNVNKAIGSVHEVQKKIVTGNSEMKKMLAYMDKISEASQNIEKIIKVIDDIAFQTNVLALNASVEAARAGQHGKGFAVVAQEVRNLSVRTTGAVDQTHALIEEAVSSVMNGMEMSGSVSKALEEIKNSMAEVADHIEIIGSASASQTGSIGEINDAMGVIAGVVHTNSSTAEETAAASEELSGQAKILDGQTRQFRLN